MMNSSYMNFTHPWQQIHIISFHSLWLSFVC
jgi:hypothetical protein